MPIRLKGPLFSLGITEGGSIGPITYTRDGRVYPRVSPVNPMTAAQGNIRQTMSAMQTAISHLGPTPRNAVSAVAPVGYRWNSYLFGETIGTGFERFTDALAAYANLAPADQAAWITAGQTLGLVPTGIDYASNPAIDEGQTLFALCNGLWLLGLGPAAPVGTNSAAWLAYIQS